MKARWRIGLRALPLLLTSSAVASVYDVVADFSATNNPTGTWSYGSTASLGGFDLYTAVIPGSDGASPVWLRNPAELFVGPLVWKNLGAPAYGVPTGKVSLHPGPTDFSGVRWTSPESGLATVTGAFGAGDIGLVSVWILQDSSIIFQTSGAASTEAFALTTLVAPGTTVDFVVGNFDGIFADNTPLSATISVVPEPSCIGAAALLSLMAFRRRSTGPTQPSPRKGAVSQRLMAQGSRFARAQFERRNSLWIIIT
ncbi:MAG TPA: hypothetical protein VGM03_07660 [Phycisphaerae bacterium]